MFGVRALTCEFVGRHNSVHSNVNVHCDFYENIIGNICQTLKMADPCFEVAPTNNGCLGNPLVAQWFELRALTA